MLSRHVRRALITRSRVSRRGVSTLLQELADRGFIHQTTKQKELSNALETAPQTLYSGIDPTAPALHIGHLFPLMCVLHFHLRNHNPIYLIGGATGLVGDPSGRTKERSPADVKQVEDNVVQLTASIKRFFVGASEYASSRGYQPTTKAVNVKSNLEWHGEFKMLDFLQQVGSHARVNTMLARDSVKSRLDSHQGMSFTEFTYQLLQAYDFYYLHKTLGCRIQVGGSDQWGNIVAGVELISKLNSSQDASEPFGVTTPLLTTASGDKFGKSAGNAVWMQEDLTSVFDFYQYFIKVEDADVYNLLKVFTLLPLDELHAIMTDHNTAPEKRIAQRKLAAEVTELVHGAAAAEQAVLKSEVLFRQPNASLKLDSGALLKAFESDPRLRRCSSEEIFSVPLGKLAAKHGLVTSNAAARNLIHAKGLYFNDIVVPDSQYVTKEQDLVGGRVLVLRAGKDKMIVLALEH
ncbi:tyrosyl-tRNA synthetase [Cylindrobasidium torrendii FP15055 ss-10]|uniref:Tyrosine--tRNA ligase n=1 Tax=Cylindrobasidium torrendii FP15055 ss-10 TaxID=1314674 RepID=A0A0D7BTX4_9AGAR|nr:tyrosyl-tRNA synthetase [Cylindrobasidium torrendii FP15055 ss-10]